MLQQLKGASKERRKGKDGQDKGSVFHMGIRTSRKDTGLTLFNFYVPEAYPTHFSYRC